jgi:serine/threonine-protein kinase
VWALPAAVRPPNPLPRGIAYGEPGEYRNEADDSILVWVPPAAFTFGMDEGERWLVRFERGYFIGKYEVTWAQWKRFRAETGYDPPQAKSQKVTLRPAPKGKLDHAVGFVSWIDARTYCEWAGLRLPSESEWEYAARGNLPIRFPWGNERPLPHHANIGPSDNRKRLTVAKRDGFASTSPVGHYPEGRSPFGCYDMCGNVSEWVEDCYTEKARPPADGSPAVNESSLRHFRGSSYYHKWQNTIATGRTDGFAATRRRKSVGFRVAR